MKRQIFIIAVLIASFLGAARFSATGAAEKSGTIPPGAEEAKQRLEESPRHGEFVQIEVPGEEGKLRAYVVYPERKEKAPVAIVIQEIFGLTDWIRSVADQLAADGFIAIAPDLLSGKGPGGGGTEAFTSPDETRKAVSGLDHGEVKTRLDAVRAYGIELPAANGKSATIGFCWGGAASFRYATQQPDLNAAVVYYGTSPESGYENIKSPVLGLYGENDERVNSTIPRAQEKMKELDKSYQPHIFNEAGHGFLRQQAGPDDAPGANRQAAEKAWPLTIEFLRKHTGE